MLNETFSVIFFKHRVKVFSSLQFSRGGGASSGGSSMGNAGFCSSRHTNTVKPGDQPSSSQEAAAMLCDICSTKFTLFNRKVIKSVKLKKLNLKNL